MIVISGASASGKTEVAKILFKKYGIVRAITTTTREVRCNEKDGVDYFFVSKDRFEQMLREDRFVEHTIFNGNFYGSTKDQVEENKCIVVDPAGLRAYIGLGDECVITFFLDSCDDTRLKRMLLRGDEEQKAINRLEHDKKAFRKNRIARVDYHIDSETLDLEQMADKIYSLYKQELMKRHEEDKY